MRKRFYSVSNMLLSSAISMLGLGGCKTVAHESLPVTNEPPPIIHDTIVVKQTRLEEMKVVYGPPVVHTMQADWQNEVPDRDGVYYAAEEMPRFPGGEEAMYRWIGENINLPEEARRQGLRGNVMVSFIVRETGKTDGVVVLRPVHPLLDAEAIRLVKSMPAWIPGRQEGKAVAVRYFMPVDLHP